MNINLESIATPKKEAQSWRKLLKEQSDILLKRFDDAIALEDYDEVHRLVERYVLGVFVGKGMRGMPGITISETLKVTRDYVSQWLDKSKTLTDEQSQCDALRDLYSFVCW